MYEYIKNLLDSCGMLLVRIGCGPRCSVLGGSHWHQPLIKNKLTCMNTLIADGANLSIRVHLLWRELVLRLRVKVGAQVAIVQLLGGNSGSDSDGSDWDD